MAATGELLADLDPQQRAAVTAEGEPLCILAGAGSGKTRVLTRRVAWRIHTGTASAPHVLALTFTRRSASELGSRLASLGIRDRIVSGTFHSVAYSTLRRRWADEGEAAPALLDRKVRLLSRLMPPLPVAPSSGARPAEPNPADVATEIEWAKARLIEPGGYPAAADAAGRRPALPLPVVADVYERYEQEKRRRRLVDFDDLLILCARALADDPAFAAAVRWRHRHVFVDEFQDVNPAQFDLLRQWLGQRADLCVVGDANQAIYGWNGADPSYLDQLTRWFPGATTVRLDHNYRSSPHVLAVASSVVPGGGRLRAHAPAGPVPTLRSFADDREEAAGIARALRRWQAPGRPWSGAAVLTRTHAQLVLIEQALRASSIPCRVRGADPFLELPGVREALGHLARLPGGTPLARVVADLTEAAGGGSPPPGREPDEARAGVAELARIARDQCSQDPSLDVAGLLNWLKASFPAAGHTRAGAHRPSGRDTVDLATLHAAKGLEWPVVFLAGLEQGLVPIGHATTPQARAEERRLLYVGITRAEQELHVSWAEERTFGERTVPRSPSPYLERIRAAITAVESGDPSADWRQHLADGRRQLGGTPMAGMGADEDVLAALKSWRAAAARAWCIPPYVVFHDTTLAAVAEARPTSREALVRLPGVGPVKAERYGDALLSVLASAG